MNRIKFTSAFVAAVLVIVVFAGIIPTAVGANGESDLFEEIKPLVDIYNQNVDRIPFIGSLIGEERINAEISLSDGSTLIIGITTNEDAKITSFEEGAISDPSLMLYTDENTLLSIINSDDPVSAAQDALDSGAIRLEGVGIGGKMKVGVVKFAIKIAGFFI